MSSFIALIAVAGVVAAAWRYSYWPFDGTYKSLPRYGATDQTKGGTTTISKPAE